MTGREKAAAEVERAVWQSDNPLRAGMTDERALAEAPPAPPHVPGRATDVAEDVSGSKAKDVPLPTCSSGHGGMRMTPSSLRQLCDERDMYTTPELNTVLFLGNVG